MTTTVIFRTIGPSYIQTTPEMRSPPLIQDRIKGFLYAIGGEKGEIFFFQAQIDINFRMVYLLGQ